MNILFVHNNYQHAGGEDAVLQAEMNLVVTNGERVNLANRDNLHINTIIDKLKVFMDVVYSSNSKQWMLDRINQHNPDIVHVHNFFPLLTPSIYDACIDLAVPVVQTLHNYRTICPGALLMRNRKICEDCITDSAYKAVGHSCYRNSMIGSFAVARMVDHHRKNGTWQDKVNRFIALTKFARKKFVEANFPKDKIIVKPNFVLDNNVSIKSDRDGCREGALFVGRLSAEKGVSTLLNTWKDLNITLRIAGSGPLDVMLNDNQNCKILHLGNLDKTSVLAEMNNAAFLVMPSEGYEGFPMVLVEAFSSSLPVIASRLGGMAEIVEDGVTGLHFEAGNTDDLASKVLWMNEHPEECRQMGQNARKVYEEKYTPEKNYEMLMDIYQQAIDDVKL